MVVVRRRSSFLDWSYLIGGLAFVALMCGWSSLLAHNLARVERLTKAVQEQSQRNLLMLSADSLEYRDYFERFPTSFGAMSEKTVSVEFYKRPLYGPISATLTVLLSWIGFTFPISLYAILSFYASTAVLLAFKLFRIGGLPAPESVLLAAVCSLSFGWLTVFSIPESYSLTACGALIAMISGARLGDLDLDRRGAAFSWVRHAVVSGVAAWLYLPIAGAVLLLVPVTRSRQHWRTVMVPAIAIAAAVAIAPQFWFGLSSVESQLTYGGRWSTLAHFADVRLLAEVGSAFLFFGLVSPVPDFLYAKAELDLSVFRVWSPALPATVLLVGCYVALWAQRPAGETARRVSGALLWLATLFAFHVYFNPREVLLYLTVPVAVLVYSAAQVLAPRYKPVPGLTDGNRFKTLCVLLVFVCVLIASNYRAVVGN